MFPRKIVAESKLDVLLEGVEVQQADRRELSSFFDISVSMALVRKREKDERSVLTCTKSDRVALKYEMGKYHFRHIFVARWGA